MKYSASKPLAIIQCTASFMVLYIHRYASFLSGYQSRSCASGHFFLSGNPNDPNMPHIETPPSNCAIYTSCKILDVVVGSVTEAEIGATYNNAHC